MTPSAEKYNIIKYIRIGQAKNKGAVFFVGSKVKPAIMETDSPKVLNRLKNFASGKLPASTVAGRMTIAYLPLVAVIVMISVYTLSSLDFFRSITKSIVNNSMVVIEGAESLSQSLLAQEAYGRRYLIMKSPEMLELFWKKDADFNATLGSLRRVVKEHINSIGKLHKAYNDLYAGIFKLKGRSLLSAGKVYDSRIREGLDAQLKEIKSMMAFARRGLAEKIKNANILSMRSFYIVALLSMMGICVGIGAAYIITRNISRSIQQLRLATAKFSERKFDFVPDLAQRDEFGVLARSFTAMAQQLARFEVMDLDANPLTRLPGGIAIENVLEKRLSEKREIAFCMLDIDNFKSFNDRYGYARGNDVIKATGKLLEEVLLEHGTENAFLGHIGGDDFAMIVDIDRYHEICQAAIDLFDRKIPEFYDQQDREKGYIMAKTRKNELERFPIMTISIAVVTNQDGKYSSSVKVGEVAAELKEYAKTISGSIYLVDRRKQENVPGKKQIGTVE